MRILHICAYTWAIGGPAKTIFDHTRFAVARGHQVDILSPLSPGDELYPAAEGVRVIPCLRTPGISRFFPEFSLGLYHYLRRHLRDYDLIHCHGVWHFGSIAPFWLDRTVPKVVTIHGLLDPWALRHGGWKKQLMSVLTQRDALKRADLIHVLNEEEEQDVYRYLGYRHPKVVVVPNGIETADYAQLPPQGTFRQQLGLPADAPLVLFLSRLNIKKGLDLLLPAFKAYREKNPRALLILAGPDDGYQAAAEAFVREHQLGDSVRLVGMLTGEKKRAALADADLFVLPSYSEGLSMAVLEAMAAGVPALVSAHVGLGRQAGEAQAVELTELNPEAITRGLDRLLGDPRRRETLRKNALRLVRDAYDLRQVAQQLLDEYDKILTARQPAAEPTRL